MNKRSFISFLLIFALVFGPFSNYVYASDTEETDGEYVTEGDYNFTSSEKFNRQYSDHFIYRDDCFMRSSFLGCQHLMELSSQAAISSTSWYGEYEDQYEKDPTENYHNVVNMLNDMGFQNVSTNKYYTLEKLENSCGVAVGQKEIEAGGDTYTLLAIIPRCGSYKQEWVGNFNVGEGDIHIGFQMARDEVLRYVKQYISENGISGKLKVWIAGHSRGAAIANMIGGFFAGGGIEYFGNSVSITPEDVYCYTFETPKTIKEGADKKNTLSVGGVRDGYPDDTPGAAYTYSGSGTIDPEGEEYGGIKNFIFEGDLIAELPPAVWGFEYYGTSYSVEDDGNISTDDMLAELQDISSFVYNEFLEDGDYRNFANKTFDLKSLQMIDDPDSPATGTMGDFLRGRVKGLMMIDSSAPIDTNEKYVSYGFQDSLKSVAGLFGLLLETFLSEKGGYDELLDGLEVPIDGLALTFLAYASERADEEAGTHVDEAALFSGEAVKIVEYLTGKEYTVDIDNMTMDDFAVPIIDYLVENEDSELVDKLLTALNEKIEEDPSMVPMLRMVLEQFYPGDGSMATVEELLREFVKACSLGPSEESTAYSYGYDAATARAMLFLAMGLAIPDEYEDIKYALNPYTSLTDFMDAVKETLLIKKDAEGKPVINAGIPEKYGSINEAADERLKAALEIILLPKIEMTKTVLNDWFYNESMRHFNNLMSNITNTRKIVSYLLMYNAGEKFDSISSIKNVATFIGNAGLIPVAHYNEVNIAWARAASPTAFGFTDHHIEVIPEVKATCTSEGNIRYYHLIDVNGDEYFADKSLSEKLDEDGWITDKLEHSAGKTVVENYVEATEEKEGSYENVVYCTVCGEEISREKVVIPKIEPEDSSEEPKDREGDTETPENTTENSGGKSGEKTTEGTTENKGSQKDKKAANTADITPVSVMTTVFCISGMILLMAVPYIRSGKRRNRKK